MVVTYGNPNASIILIQMVDDHDFECIEPKAQEIQRLTNTEFCLIAQKVQNWNDDLSPGKAPEVFGKEGFGDGAARILASVLECSKAQNKIYSIGGYSLAGLFALWAVYQKKCIYCGCCGFIVRVVSRFADYMKVNGIKPERFISVWAIKKKKREIP